MRKTKKQLLGLAGLAAVAILTVIACAMPKPAAAAEEVVGSDGVTVMVLVGENNQFGRTISPADESETVDGVIRIATEYKA